MKFTAAGDAIIQRRIPKDYEGFDEIKEIINQGDIRFFNLEATLNYEGEACASQFSGGTYIRTNPDVLEDLEDMGFNMTSFNNNHAMDYSYDGLLKTLEYLNESNFVHAGVGRNLDEAMAPKFIDTKEGRVALISVNTTFNPAMMAGKQTGRIKGRPGIFGIRKNKKIVVDEETFSHVKAIYDKMNLGASREILVKEGYEKPLPDNIINMEGTIFECGEDTGVKTWVNPVDLERVKKSIEEAKFLADYVMISMHAHEMQGTKKENHAQYIEELAHKCVDFGADAVVGHGPHLIRAVEVYKEKPIFYSLGDFILELYSVEFAPDEFYAGQSLTAESTVYELLKTRSRNFTVGLMEQRVMNQCIVPLWETENGKLKSLKLYPVELKMDGPKSLRGLPYLAKDDDIFEKLTEMCKPYGLKLKKKDNYIECEW